MAREGFAQAIISGTVAMGLYSIVAAAQGVDFRRQVLGDGAQLGRGTRHAYALVRQAAPFVEVDTVLYPHMEAVRQLVASGALIAAVNAHVADDWRL